MGGHLKEPKGHKRRKCGLYLADSDQGPVEGSEERSNGTIWFPYKQGISRASEQV